jgi:hypothetical protein
MGTADARDGVLAPPGGVARGGERGVYEAPGLSNALTEESCDLAVDWSRLYTDRGWVRYGTSDYRVADTVAQVLAYERDRRVADPDQLFAVQVSTVQRSEEPATDGWRWQKWGPYIGTRTPPAAYLYDEPEIGQVVIYHFNPVVGAAVTDARWLRPRPRIQHSVGRGMLRRAERRWREAAPVVGRTGQRPVAPVEHRFAWAP